MINETLELIKKLYSKTDKTSDEDCDTLFNNIRDHIETLNHEEAKELARIFVIGRMNEEIDKSRMLQELTKNIGPLAEKLQPKINFKSKWEA